MNPFVLGVVVNSALYLGAIVFAGLALHAPIATKLAICALGVTYLTYTAQLLNARESLTLPLLAASIALGAAAGVVLLVA